MVEKKRGIVKPFLLGMALGSILLVLIQWIITSPREPIPNYYEKLSDTMGRVREYYDVELSYRDIEIEELRTELVNRPVKTKVKTVIVFEEYESNPDAEIHEMEDSSFRVDWTDPLASGWIKFDGPNLLNNTIIGTYLNIFEQPLTLEIVEVPGGEWYVSVEDQIEGYDLFTVSDFSVTSLPEDNVIIIPGVILGTGDPGVDVGGSIYSSLYNVELYGKYLSEEWEAYAGYRFDCGLGMGVGASDSNITFGVSYLFGW